MKRVKASNLERARQFMPFASLRGYYDMIRESDREECEKRELTDDEKLAISSVLSSLNRGDVVKVRYFDTGGYVSKQGAVSKISAQEQTITIIKTAIRFDDILSIEKKEQE